ISVSAGAFFPASARIKNNTGDAMVAVDVHYLLPATNPLTVPSRRIVSAGVEAGASGGRHATIIPVTISQVIGVNHPSPVAANAPYYGVGLGAFFINQAGLSAATKIGGFVQGGYNLTGPAFVDVKYQLAKDADGWLVAAGYRF